MTDRLLLVSTCGTSLLTKGASPEDRAWLTEIANEVEADTARLTPIVEGCRARLKAADERTRRDMSAELNGIGAVLDRYKPKRVFHLLVHTDTAPGKATAALVHEKLGGHALLVGASGLRTNNLALFRYALADLTKQLDEHVRSHRDQGWFVVFNLTAGFKSLNGYLQALAMIVADRSVLLFEGAFEPMEIPRLPVRLSELDDLREYGEVFRRLDVGYRVEAATAKGAPETLLMELDGEVTASVLGNVAWGRHRATLFAEKLHSPLSNKVRISDAAKKAFAGLESAQKVHVNEAIDEFSAHLDHGRALVGSRKFQKLRGQPVPGSTHELYAWSDGAAGRLFGHYEGGVFVFDYLGGHL